MSQFSLTLTLLTALLLTLITFYFRFGGWKYTLFVSTNQMVYTKIKRLKVKKEHLLTGDSGNI